MEKEYKLCYIISPWVYFTSRPLTEQWGDGWGKTPYEHNSGEPYYENREDIKMIAYLSNLVTPEEIAMGNSNYSVSDINKKQTPWLTNEEGFNIYAGEPMDSFIGKILSRGGAIFKEVTA